MTISDVSDQDLTLFIGEKLGYRLYESPTHWFVWWIPNPPNYPQSGWTTKEAAFRKSHPDFVNDPAMKWMLFARIMTNPDYYEVIVGSDLEVEICRRGVRGFAFKASSLDRLPAETFGLANGWPQ